MATDRAILIVDDEFGLAEMLRDVLVELGYDVSIAINGRLALNALEEKRIDLVIADMMMPVMDGPELARAMRADPRFTDVPIILMTSLPTHEPPEPEHARAVLRKPFTPDALLRTVESCFGTALGDRDKP